MYINNLSFLTDLSNFTLFADDLTVAMRDNNIEALSHKCNIVLDILNTSPTKNRLTINIEITKFIIFSNREHQIDDSSISIGLISIQNANN